MERWRARLNIAADAPEQQQEAGQEPEAAAAPPDDTQQQPPPEDAAAAEYRFLGQQEQQEAGDAQALAPATEQQAQQQQQQGTEQDEQAAGGGDAAAAEEEQAEAEAEAEDMDAEQQQGDLQKQQLNSGTANWGAGGERKAGLEAADSSIKEGADGEGDGDGEEGKAEEGEEDPALDAEGQQQAAADDSYVAARLQTATLEDSVAGEEVRCSLPAAAAPSAAAISPQSRLLLWLLLLRPCQAAHGTRRHGQCCRALSASGRCGCACWPC
jgi:hypothetical protein